MSTRVLLTLSIVLLAGACGHGRTSTRGGAVDHFTIHSASWHRRLHGILGVPPQPRGKPWLLVLLHGATGSPDDFLSQQFFDGLAKLGPRGPEGLLPDAAGA